MLDKKLYGRELWIEYRIGIFAFTLLFHEMDARVLQKWNHILVGTLNIFSDIGILVIPLPILFSARIPIHRKLILLVLFSSGIFVIIAVCLRITFSFRDIDSIYTAGAWAIREVFVGIIVVTAPGIKPVFNKARWLNFSSNNASTLNKYGESQSRFHSFNKHQSGTRTTIQSEDSELVRSPYYELSTPHMPKKPKSVKNQPVTSRSSQEDIAKDDDNAIHVVTEYRLEHESGDDSDLLEEQVKRQDMFDRHRRNGP
ncbi:hypothetical protein AJ79_02469 [Helicocarpus griseus UAMH5409]|uniref:Rhodopsin domain-containing protein n=1 Tax=Helicocarpus griseus UAMH5409 TaxID=1447875 RepID=A0A2B7XU61_9EURO|nr:hypothetical protein AJ79_02469 [Helicocarpus griseus UAMH5409]